MKRAVASHAHPPEAPNLRVETALGQSPVTPLSALARKSPRHGANSFLLKAVTPFPRLVSITQLFCETLLVYYSITTHISAPVLSEQITLIQPYLPPQI